MEYRKDCGKLSCRTRTSVYAFRRLILKFGGLLRTVQTTFVLVILKVYCINIRSQPFQEAVTNSLTRSRLSYLYTLSEIHKVHPVAGLEGPEMDQRYSCTLSLTSVLDGGECSTPRPGRFTPGKTRYPL